MSTSFGFLGLYLKEKLYPTAVKSGIVDDADKAIVLLLLFLRIFWLCRGLGLAKHTDLVCVLLLLPSGAGGPVQVGAVVVGVVAGVGAGGVGVGPCGVQVSCGLRRLCADLWPSRDLMEVSGFLPSLDLTEDGIRDGMLLYFSLLTGGPWYAEFLVVLNRLGGGG